MTTADRKSATSAADLRPELFGLRDETGYKNDLVALQEGGDARGLKENSIINEIKFFHCARVGALAPCMMHDVYSGKLM